MFRGVKALGNLPAVRQTVAVGVQLGRVATQLNLAVGRQSVLIGVGIRGQLHLHAFEVIKNVLLEREAPAEVSGVELAELILFLGVDAPGPNNRSKGNLVAGLDVVERGKGDGHLDEAGVGFLRLAELLRRAVELLKADARDIAKRLVEAKHPLAKREWDVLRNDIRRGAAAYA